MNCLSTTQILLFLEKSLSQEERARVEEHVDICPECRDLLADAALCTITSSGKHEVRDTRKEERVPEANDDKSASALPIGATLKHYEIIRQLGRGGMGRVYLARDLKLGRLVAIKLLVEYGGAGTSRLIDEARATARCKHENIVVVYEVDEQQGFPYMVLEHIEGSTLRTWMEQRAGSPVPLDVVLDLAMPIVRALECAHEQGVVHRDLKPENVLISSSGTIKVLDFGIAKQLSRLINGPGDLWGSEIAPLEGIHGTLPYMAPEQQWGEEIDARTDLWAAGIVLYELCTGAHPLAPLSIPGLRSIRDLDLPMPSLLQKRPDAAAMAAVVSRCLAKKKSERFGTARELLTALEALRSPGEQDAPPDGDAAPFAGLAAFQETDKAQFHGRDQEVTSVVERLRRSPLLAVTGPTGAGKSSFVRAGVIPALKRSGERWEAFVMRPGHSPLASLAEVLAVSGMPDRNAIAERLRSEPGQVGALLRAHCRDHNSRVLLFIDQFEELYTLGANVAEREAFVSCLEGVADDASSPLRIMLAIRSDFLDRMAEGRRLTTEVIAGLVLLPAMGRNGLREVLTMPVEALDHRFEDSALVDEIVDALEGARSALPLLQFTAMKLWEARDRERRLLTRSSYEALGGIAGALSVHAGAVIHGFPSRDQRLCREILLRLVTPERTRAIVRVEDLHDLAHEGEDERAIERVVHQLADARLLTIEGPTVELIHESLIERWPQLRRWIEDSAEDAPLLARLRAAAQQWESSREADGLLWRDEAAQEAIRWLSRRDGETGTWITVREERFLKATVALSERAQRRRRQALAGLVASLVVVAVLLSLLDLRANREATNAREQATRADQETVRAREQALRADQEAARALSEAREARNATRVAVATREMDEDPTTALAVLRELEPPTLPQGWSDLAFTILHDVLADVVLIHPEELFHVAFSPDGERVVTASRDGKARVFRADGTGRVIELGGHEDGLWSASFSPDGERIITASADDRARIFRADGTGEPLVSPTHGADVTWAAFSPDGARIVTGAEDGTIRVFREGFSKALVLGKHQQGVLTVAFSPDGTRVVSASKDSTVRVWNADGTGTPVELRGHHGWVFSALFSPDGNSIVTAGDDRTARIFSASGTGKPLVFQVHNHLIAGAVLSPDGTRIATASFDKTARIATLDGAGQVIVLRGHSGGVRKIVFSPDGKRVATASQDGTVRIWDAQGGNSPIVLRGHTSFVVSAAFDPTGRYIVTSSWDKTARIWDSDGKTAPRIFEGHTGKLTFGAFSPDGRRIVTTSEDGTAHVFRVEGGPAITLHTESQREVNSASWSPDGVRIVTASVDGKARIWNADGSGTPMVLEDDPLPLYWASWSPDGTRIATASEDKKVRLWNADGSGTPIVLSGHVGMVDWVSWSADGKRVLSAAWDNTARVWNADGSGQPLVLTGHRDTVWTAVFSPDGTRILTTSQDKTARLWSADGTGDPIAFEAHPTALDRSAFSPDGTRIVTASDDGTARIWTALHPIRDPSDPALWSASSYCLTPKRRQELLKIPPELAEAQQAACQARVERFAKR